MNAARAHGETELIIDGMTCSGCARHVTEALQSVPGVGAAVVSLEHSRATVRWRDPASADETAAVRAVERAG
ncbi:MAG TPA: heavy metal-associated domain-containing protein, partial [Methylomirabilota bacterium]|nr:heavy metal-associated domain-containing protein [Methylomirabilota bacterium]